MNNKIDKINQNFKHMIIALGVAIVIVSIQSCIFISDMNTMRDRLIFIIQKDNDYILRELRESTNNLSNLNKR